MKRVNRTLLLVILPSLLLVPMIHFSAFAKVTYFYNWYGSDTMEPVFAELIEEFKETYPDIELEIIRGGSVSDRGVMDRLISLIAAGASPDVVHFERSTVIELAAKGLLHPLDRHIGSIDDKFVPGAMQEVMYNGSVYGIPWGTDIRGLFWNQADFNESGLDAMNGPSTMADLDDMAAKLTRIGGDGSFNRVGFVPWLGNWYAVGWLYTFGGAIYDDVNVQPQVNTANHIRAFDWVREFGQRYPYERVASMISGTTSQTFYNQSISMMAQYNGFANLVRIADPTIEYWAGEVPHPEFGTNGTWMGGYTHVIPSSASNKEDAITLLEWLSRKEAEVALYRITGSLPTQWDALQEIGGELSPTDAILLRQTDVAWGRPPLWSPPFHSNTQNAMVRVARLQVSPQEALDDVQHILEGDFDEILR